jgi:UPF0042 nucleotide-binding protein CLOSTHATH_02279
MKFIIMTGMSGSGKTVALKALEDYGYYCVDNIPVQLITGFADLLADSNKPNPGAVLGIDIRNAGELASIKEVFTSLDEKSTDYEIVFLDADDETLIKRYKETRRSHPLAKGSRLELAIEKERQELGFLRERASVVLNTSRMLAKELREEIYKLFVEGITPNNLYINILSFGFIYGIPSDADLVFDVRFLANPFYEKSLRLKTGEDEEVRDYILSNDTCNEFLKKLEDLTSFLIPEYIKEGKTQLVIAIGCSGGQHRSVTIAIELARILSKFPRIGIKTDHRDVLKNLKRIV